ncbi:MAG: hypothetical protein AABX47_02815 [Nanoarchaeota archaeon]
MANEKAQLLAKTLAFILLGGIAFLIGKNGYTAATVGDVQGGDVWIGIAVLALACVGAIALYIKYKPYGR